MKIAVDISGLSNLKTGIGHYTYNLFKNIIKIDRENNYGFFAFSDIDADFVGNRKDVYCDFQKILFPSSYITSLFLWNQYWLPLKLKKYNPQLLHSPNFFMPTNTSIPAVITIHDMAIQLFPHVQVWKRRFQHKMFLKSCAKKANKIIADSYATKKDIVTLLDIPEDKIKVIHLGVSEEFMPISNNEVLLSVKDKYKLPDKYIFFVGTIEPRKNLDLLINVFYNLKKKNGLLHKLVIVGQKGWLSEGTFKLIERLNLQNDIKIIGYVSSEDLPILYNLAEVFVLPSLYEGFGLPLLEAMACGCPVIGTNISSIPEVIGDAGLLFELNDFAGLRNSILKIIVNKDFRDELKIDGINRAKQFTWERTARETLEVYKTI